jgi:hypothetical protein
MPMDLISAAEILTFSRPLLDALLAGSKDKLKEIGKGLTATTLEALHDFWKRLTEARPEAVDLARRSSTEPAAADDLKRLIAEALDADPTIRDIAAKLRPAIQISNQSGGISQITGDGGVNVAGNVTGNITVNNKGH